MKKYIPFIGDIEFPYIYILLSENRVWHMYVPISAPTIAIVSSNQLTSDESFTFNYNDKRGIEFEFKPRSKRSLLILIYVP